MSCSHEGFEALLDVGKNDELIDDGVWRLCGDDSGLGDADISAAILPLLRMSNGGALHRPFHRTGATARGHIEPTKAEFIADLLRVNVFVPRDRVPTPTHDEVRMRARLEDAAIAEDREDCVRDRFRAFDAEPSGFDLDRHVDDIAEHAEEMLSNAFDHSPIDKGRGWGVLDVEPNTEGLTDNIDAKIFIGLEEGLGVVDLAARRKHGE